MKRHKPERAWEGLSLQGGGGALSRAAGEGWGGGGEDRRGGAKVRYR
jgi:hypothetical protein